MGFFELPPEQPERYEPISRSPWHGPPMNALGGAVQGDVVLVRGPELAILVRHIVAYPDGIEFVLDVRSRKNDEWDDPFEPQRRFRRRRGKDEGLPDVLRFGVEFANGKKATNLDFWLPRGGKETPDRPVLFQRGGGGGGNRWSQDFWLWPLPPPGPFAFVCEWPAKDLGLTRQSIDGQLLQDAAARTQELWEEQEESGEGYYLVALMSSEVAVAEGNEESDADDDNRPNTSPT